MHLPRKVAALAVAAAVTVGVGGSAVMSASAMTWSPVAAIVKAVKRVNAARPGDVVRAPAPKSLKRWGPEDDGSLDGPGPTPEIGPIEPLAP